MYVCVHVCEDRKPLYSKAEAVKSKCVRRVYVCERQSCGVQEAGRVSAGTGTYMHSLPHTVAEPEGLNQTPECCPHLAKGLPHL